MSRVSDTRIAGYEPLLSPAALLDELPLGGAEAETVERTRAEVRAVLDGEDDRMLVITGPCSVHDPKAALDYAARLATLREQFKDELLIVMRVYFEKPRTVTGWKGLINDPGMDGSYDVHRGLRTARRLLLDILGQGLPVGCEWLDPITPQYIADTVTWGAIGARTTESQVHRQLASGLSMPVGFKNGTDGDVQVAVDACRASGAGHTFFGVTPAGAAAVVTTSGNPDTHVILRGGRSGPNYSSSHVAKALDLITAAGLPRRIMVDASHGNSGKDYRRQPDVATSLAGQVTDGERGIVGVMLESFLVAGRQEPGEPATLTYGQSVTDACMDIETTAGALASLAASVSARRRLLSLLSRTSVVSPPGPPYCRNMSSVPEVSPRVRAALEAGRPVVALESTIVSHGLPRPGNLEAARSFEALLEETGVTPVTIAVLDGVPRAGLADSDLERIALDESVVKVSSRDLGMAMAGKRTAGTTVAATSVLAARAGIRVFATGGLGGVHRGYAESPDESADLTVLSRTPITVVSAGVKSILDIPATLERLETLGVAVAGFRTNRFPAFYLTDSGQDLDWRVDTPEEVAAVMAARDALGDTSALLIANPLPPERQLDPALHDRVLAESLAAADAAGVRGKAVTPFLLDYMRRATAGKSVAVNLDVARGNVLLAGQIATAWARLRA